MYNHIAHRKVIENSNVTFLTFFFSNKFCEISNYTLTFKKPRGQNNSFSFWNFERLFRF